jgi:predicted DNA binding CopG/RHH family protein
MNIKKTAKGWVYNSITFANKKDAELAKKNDSGKGADLSKADLENGKQRLNMWVDIDVIDVIKEKAKNQGIGYQTLINQSLREQFLAERSPRVIDLKTSELKKLIKDAVRSA